MGSPAPAGLVGVSNPASGDPVFPSHNHALECLGTPPAGLVGPSTDDEQKGGGMKRVGKNNRDDAQENTGVIYSKYKGTLRYLLYSLILIQVPEFVPD